MISLSTVILVLAILVAILFSVLVLITGKGDAMSGGGAVRTTFKGKASFDDIMSQWTLYLGAAFMVLVIGYNIAVNQANKATNKPSFTPPVSSDVNAPTTNSPAANTPATNTPAVNTPAVNEPVAKPSATNTPETNVPAANVPATNAPAPK